MKAIFSFLCLGETSGNNLYAVLHNSIYRYIKLLSFLMTAACNNSLSVRILPAAPQWLQLNIRKKSNTSYLACSTCLYFTVRVSQVSPKHHLKNVDILLSTHMCLVSTTTTSPRTRTTLDFSGDFQCCRALVHAFWK